MINIYAACCLLSALSIVELKTLDINRRVGENVTIECSDWNVWINVKSNVKYFCESPCSKDKHIIVKAAPGKTQQKKRIKLTNSAEVLFVTFTNLRKSDSKKYYCGAERFGHDLYIEVNLKVTDVGFSSPKTTPKTVIVAVTNSSTMSSSSSDINTDMSTSCIIHSTTLTAPATHGAVVVTAPEEDAGESAGPDEVYQSLHPFTEDKDQVYSTLTPTKGSAGPDEVYQSLHPFTEDNDQVYSTLTPTKGNAVLESMSVDASSV